MHIYIRILLLLIFYPLGMVAQDIRINEIVSSNTSFFDDEGDSPDWFELYNSSPSAVSLADWVVTDSIGSTNKWIFPNLVIAPGEQIFLFASGKDRRERLSPKTLINRGESFKYLVPTQIVNSNWRDPEFNDSGWLTGNSGFGFGDNDDETIIPTGRISIFLRKTFTITDTALLNRLILDVDFDDSFIAYINGQEVARSNISGEKPVFNTLALGNREATLYNTSGVPERFDISQFKNLIKPGENVLSIQTHNVSTTSSDMTIIPFLSAYFSASVSEGITPPEILNLKPSFLHTNFRLDSDGETLYLFNNAGAFVDSVRFSKIPSNYSYGTVLGKAERAFFPKPSPGLPNPATGKIGFKQADIVFSNEGGLVPSFGLTLKTSTPGDTIRYTLDATEPTETSPIYKFPLIIRDTKVVRARVFSSDYIPSPVQSRSYILNKTHDLPLISLITDPYNFFDNDSGIYAYGDTYESNHPYFGANFWERWERPINFSFYDTSGVLGFNMDLGVKIYGNYSRANDQRSMSFFARKQYGKGTIEYPLFTNRDYTKYESFVLRNSGNDWGMTMLRDAALTSLMEGSGVDFQAYRPTVTYLNGEYWGIYNMREKINEHFIASRHNINSNDIDLLELNGGIVYGDNADYLELTTFLARNGITNTANYAFVTDRINVSNYIKYQLAQIYFDNTDWPGNNIKYWKQKKGKWHWILFDTDFGFGIWDNNKYQNNTLEFALNPNGAGWPNPSWSTLLFRRLTANTTFRNQFVNQFADELNSRFLSTRVTAHLDSLNKNISNEILAHSSRWNRSASTQRNKVNAMKSFAIQRPAYVKNHILQEFNLPAFHQLSVRINEQKRGYVKVNSLIIKDAQWSGDYFENVPVRLIAIPKPGYTFSYWNGLENSRSPEVEVNLKQALSLVAVFKGSSTERAKLVINEINYNSDASAVMGDWLEIYNPNPDFVDLSGWTLKDINPNHEYTIPDGTVLKGNGYLIVAEDLIKFHDVHPAVEHLVGNLGFGLSSMIDVLKLHNNSGGLEDSVTFLSNAPWPAEANGLGWTLELMDPALNNELAANWNAIHLNGSPGKANDFDTRIAVAELSEIHTFPNPFVDYINLSFDLQKETDINIQLRALNGSTVKLIRKGHMPAGHQFMRLDLPDLPRGFYIITIMSNGDVINSSKLIKM